MKSLMKNSQGFKPFCSNEERVTGFSKTLTISQTLPANHVPSESQLALLFGLGLWSCHGLSDGFFLGRVLEALGHVVQAKKQKITQYFFQSFNRESLNAKSLLQRYLR